MRQVCVQNEAKESNFAIVLRSLSLLSAPLFCSSRCTAAAVVRHTAVQINEVCVRVSMRKSGNLRPTPPLSERTEFKQIKLKFVSNSDAEQQKQLCVCVLFTCSVWNGTSFAINKPPPPPRVPPPLPPPPPSPQSPQYRLTLPEACNAIFNFGPSKNYRDSPHLSLSLSNFVVSGLNFENERCVRARACVCACA